MANVKTIHECGECGARFMYKSYKPEYDPEDAAEKCCYCIRCDELIDGAGPNALCADCEELNANNDSKETR